MTLVATREQREESERLNAWLEDILTRNNSKRFVHRILFPESSPVSPDDEDPERVMTHKMAWGEADGKYYVYPTVMEDATGSLRNFGKDAFSEALKRRDFITFDNPDEADRFSRGYKNYWDAIGYVPEIRR